MATNRKPRMKTAARAELPEPEIKEAPGITGGYVVTCGRAEILINAAGMIELEDMIDADTVPEMIKALQSASVSIKMLNIVKGIAEKAAEKKRQRAAEDEDED